MTTVADPPILSRPLTLPCGAVLANRLCKPAMTEGLSDATGRANPRHERLYRRWSAGGAGLHLTGNVMVDWRYLERPGNVVAEDASGIEALERWAAAGTASGNHLWVQISHPGRQCSRLSNPRPVAPSAVQLKLGGLFGRPRALSGEEIAEIVARYGRTAGIVQRAGFTGVQVHAAHGYLISQFLSPRVNRRDDRWGGPLENRARFLLETVRAVRAAVGPDFPLAVKLNSADFQRGGFELADAARVAGWLAQERIDLLEVSGGTYERLRFFEERPAEAAATREREAYFLDTAQTIRAELAAVPLMVTGGFRSRPVMVEALAAGELDVVGVARPLCVDPEVPRALLDGTLAEAPRWERRLSLGGGPLGPASGSKLIRGFNHQAQGAWFYRQILALADGRQPDTGLSARRALLRHFRDELRLARERRRLSRRR